MIDEGRSASDFPFFDLPPMPFAVNKKNILEFVILKMVNNVYICEQKSSVIFCSTIIHQHYG